MNKRAMVLSSFAADALALGAHWVYNTSVIEKKFGTLDRYVPPLGRSYHPTKKAGDGTHYGDQMLLLLETLADTPGFVSERFAHAWRSFFSTYDGYFDKATKETLENFKNGATVATSGSASMELGGAARISPLVYFYGNRRDALLAAVRAQTAMTHNQGPVIRSAVFFAEVAGQVLAGRSPSDAVDSVEALHAGEPDIVSWVNRGRESLEVPTRQAIFEFGQHCAVEAAFPGVIHLVLKYEEDLKTALVENVMAGGDSAARGMVAGMILGAHGGMVAIPESWLTQMRTRERIGELLGRIDSISIGVSH